MHTTRVRCVVAVGRPHVRHLGPVGWGPPHHLRVSPRGAGDEIGAVFSALADPTRRQVIDSIARRGPSTASQLAAELPVTRQAVVKHLQALGHAGLVHARRQGREVRYGLDPRALAGVRSWMDAVGARWDDRLAALERRLTP